LRSTISKVFQFGVKNVGIPLDTNPAKNTPVFKRGENVRDRTYTDEEIKTLWIHWSELDEPMQTYYKMLLLTGQRKTETMQMKWEDIQFQKPCKKIVIDESGQPAAEPFLADVLTITENKSNRPHQLPLSDQAVSLLEKLKPITGDSPYVFESPVIDCKPLNSVKKTTEKLQQATGITEFRLHDLRRTVATKLAELMVDQTVIKKILNHASQEVTGKHYTWYNYIDKKKEALDLWSRRLTGIVGTD